MSLARLPVPPWRWPLLLWLLLVLVLLASQWSAVNGMAQIWWHNDTFAHGMLVPPIAAWLVWRRREALAALVPAPNWAAVGLVLGVVLVGQGAWLAEINALQHFSVVFALQALTLALLGWQVARVIAFPLLFLLFAPPFGEFMTAPMMEHTADFTVSALRLSGIPVYREGMHFVIPSGHWSVVEACSGVRYLMASFMVGTLFAYVNFNGWRKRLVFMAVAFLVPIVANWLRAYLIVMLGHLTDNKLAAGADHLIYGWVFFGVIMAAMFWIGARWVDPLPAAAAAPGTGSQAVPGLGAWLLPTLLLALALVLPARWASGLRAPQEAAPAPSLQTLLPAPWQAVQRPDIWQPRFVGAQLRLSEAWQRPADAAPVLIDLGYYPTQRADAKAVNSMNQLFDSMDRRWALLAKDTVASPDGRLPQLRWNHAALGGVGLAQQLVSRRLYWVGGRFTGSEAEAKWWALRGLVLGQGDAAASVVLLTAADEAATERLDALQAALSAPLNARLGAERLR